jgi:hypothetical protein
MPVVSSTNKTWLADIRHAARKCAAATCLSIDNREDDNNLATWCATGGTGIAQQIDAQEQSPRHSTGFRPACGYQCSHTRRPTGFAIAIKFSATSGSLAGPLPTDSAETNNRTPLPCPHQHRHQHY